MTNSKKTKRYQFWINLILIVMTLTIILPFLLVFISSITDETVLIRNGYSFFPGKNKLLCISVYYQTGRENTPCVWRYNSYYSSRYLFNLMFSALLAYPLSVKTFAL